MEETEKYKNRIKGIVITITYTIIAIVILSIIGIIKVEAASYTWDTPQVLQFTNSTVMNESIAHICGNTNSCNYNNGNTVANFIQARYRIADNTLNEQNSIELNTYTVKFRIRLVGLDELTKKNLRFKMVYYPNENTTYGLATCDGAETYNIVYNNSDNDVYADYTCETFKVTTPFTHFGIIIGSTPNTLFLAQISQQLIFIGPGEATNDDVINSLDNGFNNIINNQNHNKNEIINNNNANTDKITGAITGPGLSEESKKPIDQDGINDYTDKEEAIINKNELDKINDIDIVIDTNSNTFIWDLITRILNTNTLVFGMVITILSIGLIKLLLNR